MRLYQFCVEVEKRDKFLIFGQVNGKVGQVHRGD